MKDLKTLGFAVLSTIIMAACSSDSNSDDPSSSSNLDLSSSSNVAPPTSSSSSETVVVPDPSSSSSETVVVPDPSSSSEAVVVLSSSSNVVPSSSSETVVVPSSSSNAVPSSSSEAVVLPSSSSVTPSSSSVAPSSSSVLTFDLTCTGLSKTAYVGSSIYKPAVKCNNNTISNPTFDTQLNWDSPSEGSWPVEATGACGSVYKTADCGTVVVSEPALICDMTQTIKVGTAPKVPTVKCGSTTVATSNIIWETMEIIDITDTFDEVGKYNIYIRTSCGSMSNKVANCGNVTVEPAGGGGEEGACVYSMGRSSYCIAPYDKVDCQSEGGGFNSIPSVGTCSSEGAYDCAPYFENLWGLTEPIGVQIYLYGSEDCSSISMP